MRHLKMTALGLAAGVAVASPAMAQTADWGGLYLGGSASSYSVEPNYAAAEASGTSFGLHGGVNFAVGPQIVVGGELNFSLGSHSFDVAPSDEFGYDLSLRLRAGYAVDQFLVYGLVGPAGAVYSVSGVDLAATGMIKGLGGEYKFSPNLSGRLEYTKTNYDSIELLPPGPEFDAQTISLGLSFHF